MTRVWKVVSGFLVVVTVSAGCATETGGAPVREPTTSAETYGAPPVTEPVDVSGFLERPCTVLTPAQLAQLTIVEPGEADTESAVAKNAGPGCRWHRKDTAEGSVAGMGFLTGNKNGLSDTYRGRDRFEYFVETTVDGYPAVFNELSSDGPAGGDCTITVGVSDTVTFRASEVGGPHGDVVCERTKEFASAILATLKAGA